MPLNDTGVDMVVPSRAWALLASALLALSGALTIAASAQRWWPGCRLGQFDSASCFPLQDNAYDLLPAAPWIPVGIASELYGVALLVLAVAVLLMPLALMGRRPGPAVGTAAVMVAACLGTFGFFSVLSGLAGRVVAAPGPLEGIAVFGWILGLPVFVLAASFSVGTAPADEPLRELTGRQVGGRLVLTACLAASNPLGGLLLAPLFLGYTSHDATPWSEAVAGVLLIIGAAALLLAAPRRVGRPPGPSRSSGPPSPSPSTRATVPR